MRIFEDFTGVIQVALDQSDLLGLGLEFLCRCGVRVASDGEDLKRSVLFDQTLNQRAALFAGRASHKNGGHC